MNLMLKDTDEPVHCMAGRNEPSLTTLCIILFRALGNR